MKKKSKVNKEQIGCDCGSWVMSDIVQEWFKPSSREKKQALRNPMSRKNKTKPLGGHHLQYDDGTTAEDATILCHINHTQVHLCLCDI